MRGFLLAVCTVLFYMLLPLASAMAATSGDRPDHMAEITDVRLSTGDGILRVVLDATKPVTVKKMILSNPTRLVVDIKDAWVTPKSKRDGPLDSPHATRIRVAQFDKNTVRVVLEITEKGISHNVFVMEGGKSPARVVMDIGASVSGGKPPKEEAQESPPEEDPVVKEASKDHSSRDEEEKREQEEDKADKDKDKDKSKDEGSTDDEIALITGLKGKVITIDPGHGGSDSGAIGPTGVMEKNVTLRVSLELQKLLKEEGAIVHMTRTKDTEVSAKKSNATDIEELQARCDIANKVKSDIFLSIHMDSFTNKSAKGTTGYYYAKGSRRSRELADKIRANLVDQLGTSSRGTQTCNFYVVRHTDMPATLIEIAFISNPEEEKMMDSKEGIQKAALAIADGIADYFG